MHLNHLQNVAKIDCPKSVLKLLMWAPGEYLYLENNFYLYSTLSMCDGCGEKYSNIFTKLEAEGPVFVPTLGSIKGKNDPSKSSFITLK